MTIPCLSLSGLWQSFLVSHELTLLKSTSQVFCKMPSRWIYFPDYFLMIKIMYLGQFYHRNDVLLSVNHTRAWHSPWLFDKIVPADIYTVMLILFVFNEYFGEMLWDYMNMIFLLKLLPTNFNIHWYSSPVTTITLLVVRWWFSSSLISSTFINWNSSIRKSFPFP